MGVYADCMKCKYGGNMCKFLIAQAFMPLKGLEILLNTSLSYMRFRPETPISVSLDIECKGFTPKDSLKEKEANETDSNFCG